MSTKKRRKQTKRVAQQPSSPVIRHYTAVSRSPLGWWWHEKRRFITTITLAVVAVLALGWIIFEVASRLL